MYLGIDFDHGYIEDGGNKYRMLVSEVPMLRSASNENSYSITMEKVYQILLRDFVALTLYQPKQGQSIKLKVTLPNGTETPSVAYGWYQVDSVTCEREGSPMDLGSQKLIHVRVTIQMTLITPPNPDIAVDPYTDPWDLPPYNFKMGTELIEDSVQQFYNAAHDTNGDGYPDLEPFVNTAGVPLQATRTRPLVRISFSFNLPAFDPRWSYYWTGSINDGVVTICGITFQAGQVKLESVSMEVCHDEHEYEDIVNGETVTVTENVNYTRCDIVLLVDPQYMPFYNTDTEQTEIVHGFMRQYLNIGTNILRDDGLHRIWSAQTSLDYLYKTCKRLNTINTDPDADVRYQEMETSLGEQLVVVINRNASTNYTYPAILNTSFFEGTVWNGNGSSTIPLKSLGTTIYGTAAEMIGFQNAEEVSENMFLNKSGSGLMPIDDSGRQVPSFKIGYIERIATFDTVNSITGVPTGTGFLYPDGTQSGFILPTIAPYIWNYETTNVEPSEGAGE